MYEIFIARRYLRAKRQISLVTLISTIATIGVAIGVAALICALAVFNGFSGVVTSMLVGFDPHVRIEGVNRQPLNNYAAVHDTLAGMPELKAFSRYVDGRVAVIHHGNVRVMSLRGADKYIAEATGVTSHVIAGAFNIGESDGLNGIVLGVVLADRLGITLGDTISIISPVGLEQTLTQFAQPITMRFRVTGVFSAKEYDTYYGFTDLGSAQSLFGKGDAVDGVEIRLHDIQKSDEVKAKIESALASAGVHAQVLTWYDLHKDLYSVMEIERWVAYILLCIIIVVAAFTILGSLTMTVIEKQRDIGLLKAVGASDKSVRKIFLYAGALIGVIGVVCGSALGWLLCWIQEAYHPFFRLDSSVYMIPAIPVEMRVSDFIIVGAAGLVLCALAAFYPAKRAARVLPAEALRWE